MDLESQNRRFYDSLVSRDRRFDGRFFTAVKTTGIYCRPICPARTPLRQNVIFYPAAAAAEAAGFRPCRRCRPDAAPGTPGWLGSSAIVNRALRLLAKDAAAPDRKDAGTEAARVLSSLSVRLGIGDRQLRRLFVQHLGAPPHAIRQLMRLDFARQLVDRTQLPVSEIAFAAGFASIRRFNTAFKARFRAAPSTFRSGPNARGVAGELPVYSLRISFRPPYDWRGMLTFLRGRAVPGVEVCTESSYARTFAIDGDRGWFQVRCDEKTSTLNVDVATAKPARLMEIVARVRRIFDTDADPAAVTDHLSRIPELRRLAKSHLGVRVPGAFDGFELAVRAVLGQQISVAGARTLAGRLATEFGERTSFPEQPELTRTFPSAATLRRISWDGMALPGTRKRTLANLAEIVAAERLTLDPSADAAAVVARLGAIPGIGPWTTGYIAMRALGDPDAYPENDLILKRAAVIGDACRPWRAYAAMLLWRVPQPPRPRLPKQKTTRTTRHAAT